MNTNDYRPLRAVIYGLSLLFTLSFNFSATAQEETAESAESAEAEDTKTIAGAQRSSFYGKGSEYMCLSVAWPAELDENITTCMTIGIQLSKPIQESVNFVTDPTIPKRQVGDICEKCGVHNCEERVSPASALYEKSKDEKAQDAIEAVLSQQENYRS